MNWLNDLTIRDARAVLLTCCGSTRWADEMARARPFENETHLIDTADAVWKSLEKSDFLEAFSAHPRIGDKEALKRKFSRDRWAEGEQAGTAQASDAVIDEFAVANRHYEERFGYIFIVCATGKSANEMLLELRVRLDNAPEDELRVAAGEQAKITRLRLQKMLEEHSP